MKNNAKWAPNLHTVGFQEALSEPGADDVAPNLPDQSKNTSREEKERLGKFIRGL
ncbi:hypothetical protein K7432_016089 [Basidiobolus ranarum]|uniref:Uncharacterized protein n=1 Tax=Basidiobolus ranarum TaxID=34480 RepID=A0ABR2WF87_9FUNG